MQHPDKARLEPVKFFVDEKLFGQAETGPPYALEWTDENPFEPREISAEVCDDESEIARDIVDLKPLEVLRDLASRACCSKRPSRNGPVNISAG